MWGFQEGLRGHCHVLVYIAYWLACQLAHLFPLPPSLPRYLKGSYSTVVLSALY